VTLGIIFFGTLWISVLVRAGGKGGWGNINWLESSAFQRWTVSEMQRHLQEEAGSGTPVPQETEGDVRWGETLMSSPEALLSAHSSYADVSLPEHELAEVCHNSGHT